MLINKRITELYKQKTREKRAFFEFSIYRTALFKAYDTDHKRDAGDLVLGHLKRRVVLVIRYHFQAVIGRTGHEAFAEDPLFTRGNNMAFVPLDKRAIVEDGTRHHVTAVIFGVHARS